MWVTWIGLSHIILSYIQCNAILYYIGLGYFFLPINLNSPYLRKGCRREVQQSYILFEKVVNKGTSR